MRVAPQNSSFLKLAKIRSVVDVVLHPSPGPDCLSILTYISQLYHKLSHYGSDSGVSSLDQSSASSEKENPFKKDFSKISLDTPKLKQVKTSMSKKHLENLKNHLLHLSPLKDLQK